MTRVEAGITPDRQWNALGEIVSAVLDRVMPVLGDRPLTFDVPDTLQLARFDAGLLDQALDVDEDQVGLLREQATLEGIAAVSPELRERARDQPSDGMAPVQCGVRVLEDDLERADLLPGRAGSPAHHRR